MQVALSEQPLPQVKRDERGLVGHGCLDPHCPICGSQSQPDLRDLYDDRYGYPGRFALRECKSCGHKCLDTSFSPQQLERLYSTFYPRSSLDLSEFAPSREAKGLSLWMNGEAASAFRWVPRNVRVLDIGCGFGNTLAYHEARGCDVYGVEADENIRRVADKYGFKVHVGLFDPNLYEPGSFDYVTLDQVIEHVTDPIKTIRGIAQVLKSGGTAVLSMPNDSGWGSKVFGKRWINWHAPYHLQFFSLNSMRLAAEQAGLTVQRTMTITPSAWLHYQWLHLLTYPSEGTPSIFWTPGGTWSLMKRIGRKAFAVAHRCKVNHVIMRVFDSLGMGDNRLFFLRKA